jgi:formiminotetrahydrofolate cyclodeaminase
MTDSLATLPLADLLGTMGSKTPAPGGGAAAGVVGATACALASMVVAYSVGKKSLADHADDLRGHAERLERLRSVFLRLADEDALAFPALQAAQKLDDTDPGKPAALAQASDAALGAPRATLACATDLLRALESLPGITNPHLASDLAIAAVLGEAAAASAAWNVRVNLSLVGEEAQRAAIASEVTRSVADAAERRTAIEAACRG